MAADEIRTTPEALRGHADNLDPAARYWVCGVLRDAADEMERLTERVRWYQSVLSRTEISAAIEEEIANAKAGE